MDARFAQIMPRWSGGTVCGLLLLGAVACGEGEGDMGADGGTGTDDMPIECEVAGSVEIAAIDDSGCSPSGYRPTADEDDEWPACITDDGEYHLTPSGDTPGSVGRVQGYEAVADLLWRGEAPTMDDFTEARLIYAEEQGLESRVLRREDLHYPPIPEDEWDPGFDPDKQCSVIEHQQRYPDRCAGPAKIAPVINEAFAAGQQGAAQPRVQAERIHAGLLWFLYLSVYKEANTCVTSKEADCDSSWAYYTGGAQRAEGLGLAAAVRDRSEYAHARIFDGVLAVRCARDLYPYETHPTFEDLPPEGQARFEAAWAQLADALHHGLALIVRDQLAAQAELQAPQAHANWAFLQVLGPVLQREAQARDLTAATELGTLWDTCPTAEAIEAGVAILDDVFACP